MLACAIWKQYGTLLESTLNTLPTLKKIKLCANLTSDVVTLCSAFLSTVWSCNKLCILECKLTIYVLKLWKALTFSIQFICCWFQLYQRALTLWLTLACLRLWLFYNIVLLTLDILEVHFQFYLFNILLHVGLNNSHCRFGIKMIQ